MPKRTILKNFMPIVLFAIFFSVVIGQELRAETDEPIYWLGVNHAPPYRILGVDENNKQTFRGIYIDVIKETTKRAGIKVAFKETPFKRSLLMMKAGKFDIMAGPNRTAERETYMHYIDVPMVAEPKAFYLRTDSNDIVSYEALQGRLIGVLRGVLYFPDFDKDETLTKKPFNDYLHAFKLLSRHRVDTVIAPEMQGDYTLLQNFPKAAFKKATYRAPGRLSYMTISRKSPLIERKNDLEKALQSIMVDGTYESIIESYR